MANPPPFPATAYDLPDWTRGVVQLTASGGGATIPAAAGGLSPITTTGAYYEFVNGSSFNIKVGPNDGKQHSLVSVSMSVYITSGTITGSVVSQCILGDNGGLFTNRAQCNLYTTALPSTGQLPSAQTEQVWPQGIPIEVQPDLTNQLEFFASVTGYLGGTISSPRLEGILTITWT